MVESHEHDQMRFQTTQWSVVRGAAASSIGERQDALEKLCTRYWMPLYVFLRRNGHKDHDAQDLVQGFFTQLLAKDYMSAIDESKGRFRSFMLVALKHFASNERDRAKTVKRGGKLLRMPIDFSSGERWYRLEPTDSMTAEKLFEHSWALTMMDNVMERLRERFVSQDRQDVFEILKPHLVRDRHKLPYAEIAMQLGCSEGSLKSTMHRMRGWYRDLLLEEIAQTVAEEEVADELRQLLDIISGNS